jgi:hypothetical protein
MSKIKYIDIAFRTRALGIIQSANKVIEEYAADNFDLTLRQLYYQFIARDLFPEEWIDRAYNEKMGLDPDTKNTQKNYDKFGVIISNGRRAGLIDWLAIVDRTRYLRKESTWEDPSAIIDSCANQFQVDLWKDQPSYVEIWFEKDALIGVFERAAELMRLPFFSCRGYVSDSECWSAARRFQRMEGKECIVLHFGDHDPSGIDMTRDIGERFALFGANVDVRRLALNMNQVKKYNPPPNPAKESDSRFEDYHKKFGDKSWELDALEPKVLAAIVKKEIEGVVDMKQWKRDMAREDVGKDQLKLVANQFDAALEGARLADNEN